MARIKGLHVHPIKDGVFSFITKGFATDEQIFGTPSYRYIKTLKMSGTSCRSLNTANILAGVFLVLKNADIFGIYPDYQVTEYDDRDNIINTYNIYRQY